MSWLVEPVPALGLSATLEEIAEAFLRHPRHEFLVLLDGHGGPVALADRTALVHDEPCDRPATVISEATTLEAAAQVVTARHPADRFVPLVCCDAMGRYCGVVRVDRLLTALAGG